MSLSMEWINDEWRMKWPDGWSVENSLDGQTSSILATV
jgi:hypothetical protein